MTRAGSPNAILSLLRRPMPFLQKTEACIQ
jgi:hypothetical protein